MYQYSVMKFINDYETEHDIKLEEKQVEAITGINNRHYIRSGRKWQKYSYRYYLYICEIIQWF